MAAQKQSYFDRRRDIVRIFDDLDALLDFCRIELLPYNPADLYNKNSQIWQKFEANERHQRWVNKGRPTNNNRPQHNNNNNNKPYRNAKPRTH